MMMVTLTKLLVIRIVANVRSESSRSIRIFLSVGVRSRSTSSISEGERLKKAISEPLAKPETTSNIIASKAAKITPG